VLDPFSGFVPSACFPEFLSLAVFSCEVVLQISGIEVSGTSTWGLCLSCQVPQISAETSSAATSSNASAELGEG